MNRRIGWTAIFVAALAGTVCANQPEWTESAREGGTPRRGERRVELRERRPDDHRRAEQAERDELERVIILRDGQRGEARGGEEPGQERRRRIHIETEMRRAPGEGDHVIVVRPRIQDEEVRGFERGGRGGPRKVVILRGGEADEAREGDRARRENRRLRIETELRRAPDGDESTIMVRPRISEEDLRRIEIEARPRRDGHGAGGPEAELKVRKFREGRGEGKPGARREDAERRVLRELRLRDGRDDNRLDERPRRQGRARGEQPRGGEIRRFELREPSPRGEGRGPGPHVERFSFPGGEGRVIIMGDEIDAEDEDVLMLQPFEGGGEAAELHFEMIRSSDAV